MRARAAVLLFSVIWLALSGCADGELFTPNRSGGAQLALQPYFSVNGASSNAEITQARLTVHQLPGGEVVGQQVIAIDPASNEWELDIDVPANTQVRILIELLSVVGGVTTVEYSGIVELAVTSGPQTTPAQIPVFPGGPENLTITAVDITSGDQSLMEGEQAQLQASVSGGPSNPVVLWTTSNAAVATVDGNGNISAVSPGSAVITAQAGPRQDEINVVVGARAARVDVAPATATATSFGSDVSFTARVVDARNAEVPGIGIVWSIADPLIATQITPGVFRARRNGTTTITATGVQGTQTVIGTATLIVQQAPTTLSLNPAAATLHAFGATQTLVAVGEDANGNAVEGLAFTWTSSDETVATVDDDGVVTAVANGVATITATAGSATAEATITVAQRASSLEVTPSEATLHSIGETVQLSAQLVDARGNIITAAVTWSSTLPHIAHVDDNGLVTATGDGVVVITARGASAQGSATINVQRTPAGVLVDPSSFEIEAGGTITLRGLVVDANGSPIGDVPVTWSSSNSAIATVSSTGVVTGQQAGEVDITASSSGFSASAHGVVAGERVPGGPFQLLILSNSSYDNDRIEAELTERMPHVTITTASSTTEMTPEYLTQFNVVLLFENGLWGQAPEAGNLVADYVQRGGNVVIGTFYWQDRSDNPYYGSSTNGWGALEALDMFQAPPGMGSSEFYSKFEYRSATLDPASIVAHPLTEGVEALSVSSYPNGMAAKPGTTVVASYTNGSPLIGFVQHSLGQRLVGVTFWPAHERQGGITGDYWRIWTNALDWAAAGGIPAPPTSSSIVAPRMQRAPANVEGPKRGGSNGISIR